MTNKEVEGFPNYLIYDDGRVWSKRSNKFMKPYKMISGYLRIDLCKDGVKSPKTIHRLLALHFIPNPENKPTVDHIDINTSNNSLSNLRWATYEEQAANKNVISNTGELYIRKTKDNRYKILKKYCFEKMLDCRKYTLQDAIDTRDYLLSM